MNNHLSCAQIVAALDHNDLAYDLVTFDHDVRIIILAYGGRVLGPFAGEDGESLFWSPAWLGDPAALGAVVSAKGADLGGERVWIAPEVQYNIRDRADLGTYRLPPQLDPGSYRLDRPAPGEWRLRQRLTLDAYNIASGQKTLDLIIRVTRLADPLRDLSAYPALVDGVQYAGYAHTVTLSETRSDAVMSQTWNLVQLNPGGHVLIPASPCAEATDYRRGAPFAAALAPHGGGFRFPITGAHLFKVGYRAAHTTGRVGYLNTLDDGRAYLLVRAFDNDPSVRYIDEPADSPGHSGDSLQVYNDGGVLGGFGELECFGRAIGGAAGISAATDTFRLWVYTGSPERITTIAAHLLGMSPV